MHVGNLEAFVNESTLYLLFTQFGTVTNVRLAGDQKFQTRYAFVEFSDSVMAHAACLLDGLQVGSRNLRVSLSKPYAGRATNPAQNPMAAMMGGGAVALMGGTSALGMPGVPSGGTQRKRSTAEDAERISRTIHVRNVDMQITEAMLVEYFGVCGTVTAARMSGQNNPRIAWIEFAAQQSALAALSLDGQVLAGQTLRISPSKSAIQTNALNPTGGAAPLGAAGLGLPAAAAAAAVLPTVLPNTIVKVQGIPGTASDDDVQRLFERQCGVVKSLMVIPVPGPPHAAEQDKDADGGGSGDADSDSSPYSGPTKMATVELEDERAVRKALELNGSKFQRGEIAVERIEPLPPVAVPAYVDPSILAAAGFAGLPDFPTSALPPPPPVDANTRPTLAAGEGRATSPDARGGEGSERRDGSTPYKRSADDHSDEEEREKRQRQ